MHLFEGVDMNTTRIVIIAVTLCLSNTSFSAEQSEVDEMNQTALETCLDAARENYGSAEVVSKPKMKKIGRTRGYAVKMKVGAAKKTINCLADRDGETMFFKGQL